MASPTTDYSTEKRLARLAGVTLAWWAHGAIRLVLALVLLYYGAAKLVFGQFGFSDAGDALIMHGEMSPMGLLWRMVAFSPLFQFLAGLAEFGAGLALLWRRTVPLGALIGAASMGLVLVLNLGYDVMVKTPSAVYVLLSLLVLIPWMPRLWRAVLGRGEIGPGPSPRLIPWRPAERVGAIAGPVAALVLAGLVAWGVSTMYPPRSVDDSVPAGVWTVAEDTAEPAAQLSQDTRWSALALGGTRYGDAAAAQLRLADGTLLTGTWTRRDGGTIALELRGLRQQGQTVQEYAGTEPETLVLEVAEQADGTLHVTGDGQDLVLAPDESGQMLHERGFSWSVRPDDPFNR
ncbi:hypothetical protein [Brachybacterium saurashtrense]|uniref:DoxX family protein n=1 Tax=Brachybacterium saurashtrense TaxID=556288 RepID=A0A345YJY6_9MICO|nr:hypothetical protein [Brachybacterium saurashtrense]AXK44238.1 hypothetical protein DWV08_00415 [Brachybacterium saurashtrense]RRR21510.1 hypothetical protein DXU92_14315 [Brachybacterium saurashtrense]